MYVTVNGSTECVMSNCICMNIYMNICIYMCVCMYAYMNTCIYMCMYRWRTTGLSSMPRRIVVADSGTNRRNPWQVVLL